MKYEHSGLLKRLEAWSPDAPDAAFPFSKRLARDNAWSLTYAQRVIREYKRFAFLAIAAGHPVTPSDQVDQAWHLHLLYTQSYWKEFCGEVLRQPLHHGPTKGGEREREKFNDWYARTLESYRAFFNEEPPSDIWPAARQRFGDDIRFVRVNTARNWVVAKPALVRGARRLAAEIRRQFLRRWNLATFLPGWQQFQEWSRRKFRCRQASNHPAHGGLGSSPRYRASAKHGILLLAACLTGAGLAGCGGGSDLFTARGWPFNLGAEPFLSVFCIVWAGTAGLAAWMRWLARTPKGKPGDSVPQLDAYESALLAGGKNRVLLTAIASLTYRGALRLDETDHRLQRTEPPGAGTPPCELEVYESVSTDSGAAFREIRERFSASPEFLELKDRLQQLGLLMAGGQRWNACLWPALLASIAPAMAMMKVVVGAEHDKPVGILIVLFLVSLAVTMAFASPPHRTRRGDAVLARLKEEHASVQALPSAAEPSRVLEILPLAVGLFGPRVLANTPVADLEKKLQASDGCGAGGCGGAGCGGGCGGCGGCG